MEYFQDQPAPSGGGYCSDPQCPCDETRIPRGEGYLYIPKECCDFRWDCRTMAECEAKLQRIAEQSSKFVVFGVGLANPILLCGRGAQKRFLNLKVAARDARHWWQTSQVPFRPTPLNGEPEVPFSKAGPKEYSACFIATAACGSPSHHDVETLRGFRDRVLLASALGPPLCGLYARLSPPLAHAITRSAILRRVARAAVVGPLARAVRFFCDA